LANKKKNKPINVSEPVKTKTGSNRLAVWLCIGVITLVTGIVFSPALQNGFTNWDDNFYVTDDPLVTGNTVPVKSIFETPVCLNYHPLTVLTLALNYQYGKLDPAGYHALNLFIHLLNTILVFFFIFLLTRRNLLMASIVSLFFGIHPMHVESVAWISERKDVLYVFFFIAALITYLRYSETKKIGWYVMTFLLFVCSCLSKGMAVVFPIILLLVDYLRGTTWRWKLVLEKIPFFLVSLLLGIVAFKIQANQAVDLKVFTLPQRFAIASYGTIMYVIKFLWPYKLSAVYPYPHFNEGYMPVVFYIMPFILLAATALVYFFLKKEREIVFGLLFYFFTVVLVLQFISVGAVIMADRYSYLPYVGLLFIVAHLVNKIGQANQGIIGKLKYLVLIVVALVAVLFSYQTFARTQVWQSSETLWNDVIDKYPTASTAYEHRGDYYYSINDMQNALSDYTNALVLDGSNRFAYYDRAMVYSNAFNKNDLAIKDYSTAIRLYPAYKKALYNRGILYAAEGKTDSALSDYNNAITIDPEFADAYTNRGYLYSRINKNDLAMADLAKAIKFDPTLSDAYNDIGILYLSSGHYDMAIANCSKAIDINPNSAPYYFNRGLGYKAINKYQQAIDDFTKGIQESSQNAAPYYYNRAICYCGLNSFTTAIDDFSKAITLDPSDPDYWNDRAFAESKSGLSENAKADALRAAQLRSGQK